MSRDLWPDWEKVLSAAARLQRIFPEAVLVGGTAAAMYVGHRLSLDADHVLSDLRVRFDEALADLESVAGRKTARVQRPVQILGSLDGIETGVRQLIREQPLETTAVNYRGQTITLPSIAEMLRIKAVLILKRNATRDYIDFAALADHMGDEQIIQALRCLDHLYPQPSAESPLQQLQIQLAQPLPYDLEETDLSEYKQLDVRWHDWSAVCAMCEHCAMLVFDRIVAAEDGKENELDGGPAG